MAQALWLPTPNFLRSSSVSLLKHHPSKSFVLTTQPHRRQQPGRLGLTVRAEAVALPVMTFTGERAGEAALDLKTARPETARAVVHRGVVTELQNRRRGTASTLTRGMVRGGGRKPYPQKGTGSARRGSQRTPLRPGGGVIFGPKPKDWSIKMNKKEKRLAITTALASAAVNTIVVDDFNDKFDKPKTKDFIAALKNWGIEPSKDHSLIFSTEIAENVKLSSRNIGSLKILTPRSLNLYDILRADKLIVTKPGLDYLNKRYGVNTINDDEEDESDDKEVAEGLETAQ